MAKTQMHDGGDLLKAPRDHAIVVDVPDTPFLMIDGEGGPSDPAFQEAIHALYALAYGMHFALKKRGIDAPVGRLEGLWWWDGASRFEKRPEKDWHWTLMIPAPEGATPELAREALRAAQAREPNPLLAKARLERYHEGRAMQILHVGPYSAEMKTLERLHEDVRKAGFAPAGKHHEVYLGDPRRAKPENLKTLLRQPVRWTDEAQE